MMETGTDKQVDMLVSVIVPAYNAADCIEDTIRSVMAQTYPHWKLLVIDDGSSDDTCAIVSRLGEEDDRVTLVQNRQNVGVAETRNKGLELCAGTCVAFLDSDDRWHPDKLALQVAKMQQENAALVYTSYAIVDDQGTACKKPYLVPAETDFADLLRENVIGCSTVLLSASVAQTYRFTTRFYHEDYCLWLQLLRDGHKAVGCQEVLTSWRLAQGSRSFDKGKGAQNRWRIYRQFLGLSFGESLVAFANYAVNGVKKYR